MTRWRGRSRPAPVLLAVAAVAIAAGVVTFLVARDGDGPDSTGAALPTTVAIPDRSTVVPAPLPDPCLTDPGSLSIWTAGVRIDEANGAADAVIRFENLTSTTCELDLTDPTVRVEGAESSVRLEPRGWGELVVGTRGTRCEPLAPLRSVVLLLNGNKRTVPTAAVTNCEEAVLAFLPADRPVDPCRTGDLTSAVVAAGLVVRNDSDRPCVLGELTSIDLATGPVQFFAEAAPVEPGTVDDESVMPDVTGLGQGDVAYFQTRGDPAAGCDHLLRPATLTVGSLAVDAEFPICTFVRLGPGLPYYGSPSGRLAGAASAEETSHDRDDTDLEAWIDELDPFRDS